jgi:capsular polysaccharide biosynthesis protein
MTFSDVEVAQALAPTFAELSTTAPLLQRVITSTGVDMDVETLARAVTTHVPAATSLLDIGVTTRDPATAAALANAIATELVNYPQEGFAPQASALRVVLTVVDPAAPPTKEQGLSIILKTVLGGAIGLFIAISLAFFVENFGRGAQSIGRDVESVRRAPEGVE